MTGSPTVTTVSRVLLVVVLVFMPYATLAPGTSPPSDAASQMHFYIMAGIIFVACMSFRTFRVRLVVGLLVFGYSALMEYFQYLLPHRHGSLDDVAINFLGSLLGFGVFHAVCWTGQMARSIRKH